MFLLFHGTSWESLNKIAENNFSVDHLPLERGKVMLFGRGVYLSELPGVSLMYGDNLLLCKACFKFNDILDLVNCVLHQGYFGKVSEVLSQWGGSSRYSR